MADWRNDIEKYLRGELSPTERHALEKKALDDPFLADALEGAEQIDPESLSTDLHVLDTALEKRIAEKKTKIIPLWVWPARIAAGLLLLAISTFIIISITRETQKAETLALTKDEPAQILSQDSLGSDTLSTADRDDQGHLSMAKPAEEIIPPSAPEKKNQTGVAAETTPVDPVVLEKIETEKEIRSEVTIAEESKNQGEALPSISSVKAKEEIAAEAKKEARRTAGAPAAAQEADDKDLASINTIVRGRVTDAVDGSGLPGVNVVIKGTVTGTITDAEGYYEISLPTPQASLVFSFIGLQSTEIEVTNNHTADVSLSADVAQLSEVVVVGYGAEEVEESRFSTFEMAAPAGGRKAFKKYLEESLQYPQQAIENKVEGKVTVQFTVETSGQLTDFKVIKGIGYGCDEEVIRLIKSGPKWSPITRDDEPVKGRVRVRMRFALPRK